MIGRIRKNNLVARAARRKCISHSVSCIATMWNYYVWYFDDNLSIEREIFHLAPFFLALFLQVSKSVLRLRYGMIAKIIVFIFKRRFSWRCWCHCYWIWGRKLFPETGGLFFLCLDLLQRRWKAKHRKGERDQPRFDILHHLDWTGKLCHLWVPDSRLHAARGWTSKHPCQSHYFGIK